MYLYPTADAAERGLATGGTGFVVCAETSPGSDRGELFVVTNSDVVREGRSPVVRINRADGGVDVLFIALRKRRKTPG